MTTRSFLISNGVVHTSNVPPVTTILENHPGAYTTSRTYGNASFLIFWDRHLRRLAKSAKIISESRPELYRLNSKVSSPWESVIIPLVDESLRNGLKMALRERVSGEELAVTSLVYGNLEVFVHIGVYVPPVFGARENGAHLAIVGRGREIASAKFSEWVRSRKCLEKLRSPSVTELLLSNDGDQILEGSVTNFFVVCRRERIVATDEYRDGPNNGPNNGYPFEVQTAPINDGVLPGVIRQMVIEICTSKGIPLREVAPSWSNREAWKEAFVTNSLRLLQHVETVKAPSCSWEQLQSKSWEDVPWEEKQFEKNGTQVPGFITTEIQRELLERAVLEGYPLHDFLK